MVGAMERIRLLQYLQLDPHSMVPQYQQLEEGLLLSIEQGRLAPGEALPSERDLAETLGISRMTVRRALTSLEARGQLRSQVGKGWYVSPPKTEQRLYQLTGFSYDMRALGHVVRSQLLDLLEVGADENLASRLGIAVGATVYVIKRRRFLDGEPTTLEQARVAKQVCPGLDRYDFARDSLYRVMREEYGLVLACATQQIEASRADLSESTMLEIEEGAPVLRSTRVAYDPNDVVLEYSTGVFRGDRYKYRVRLEGGTSVEGIV